jgi:ABC-type phosphate transport system substrate-binding protein
MKRIQNIAMRISLALGLLAGTGLANAELALIVHPSNALTTISASDVGRIYLGKSRSFPSGGRVSPVDQATGSAARTEFYNTYTGMTEAQAKSHWSKLMFSGKGQPPSEVPGGDAAVKAAVAGDASAIGYIDAGAVDSSVKALTVSQ